MELLLRCCYCWEYTAKSCVFPEALQFLVFNKKLHLRFSLRLADSKSMYVDIACYIKLIILDISSSRLSWLTTPHKGYFPMKSTDCWVYYSQSMNIPPVLPSWLVLMQDKWKFWYLICIFLIFTIPYYEHDKWSLKYHALLYVYTVCFVTCLMLFTIYTNGALIYVTKSADIY